MKFLRCWLPAAVVLVSTLAVEWIEIYRHAVFIKVVKVSTLAVEWIEIVLKDECDIEIEMSPPSRWSGLKS